ncbi:hypothetical protein [Pseudomonas oryziphila]|uniref:Uncharacterized protein n=1 Tax=Pseudomonas entomophila TaxID=312306 RepID=A0A3S8UKJ7_9PSED|nr:hypothetical protein [Pseudomonas oryziphila]AZL68818.1 hypothetical protein EJA05_14230 [Pseudomonas oryziphila]
MTGDCFKLLFSMEGASALMAQVFGVVGLLWMLIFSFIHRDIVSSTKLIGSALVLGMAFAANHVVTYGLSIFIVATLVTELHFLEKIAALFWNRDKYWEHLQKQSPSAVEEKAEAEALEMQGESIPVGNAPSQGATLGEVGTGGKNETPVTSRSSTEKSNLVERLLDTEDRVLLNLVQPGGYFEGGKLLRSYAVRYEGKYAQFDGIIKFADSHYVVEVKHGTNVSLANAAISKTKNLAGTYRKVLLMQGEEVSVRPVVLFPDTIEKQGIDTSKVMLFVFNSENYGVTRWANHR